MKKDGALDRLYFSNNDTIMPEREDETLGERIEQKELQIPFGGISNEAGYQIEKNQSFVQREEAEEWQPDQIDRQDLCGKAPLEESNQERAVQKEDVPKQYDMQSEQNMDSTTPESLHNTEKIHKLTAHMSAVEEKTIDLAGKVDNLLVDVQSIKESMKAFVGYEKAVETLKKSLAGNQRNEENMAKELAVYKKDAYFTNIRPFLEFMVQLYSEMGKSEKDYLKDRGKLVEKYGEIMFNEIIDLHKYFLEQIENQLHIQGVEIITYQPDTDFVTGEQILSKPVLTDDEKKVGKVAVADSNCYKYQDKILKKARVQVYKRNPREKDS